MLFAFIQLDLCCGHCQSQYAEFNIYAQQIYTSGPQRLITCVWNGMYELRNSGSDDQLQFPVPTHPIRLRFRVNAYVVRARCVLTASYTNWPAATIIHLFMFACISVLCALCVGLYVFARWSAFSTQLEFDLFHRHQFSHRSYWCLVCAAFEALIL